MSDDFEWRTSVLHCTRESLLRPLEQFPRHELKWRDDLWSLDGIECEITTLHCLYCVHLRPPIIWLFMIIDLWSLISLTRRGRYFEYVLRARSIHKRNEEENLIEKFSNFWNRFIEIHDYSDVSYLDNRCKNGDNIADSMGENGDSTSGAIVEMKHLKEGQRSKINFIILFNCRQSMYLSNLCQYESDLPCSSCLSFDLQLIRHGKSDVSTDGCEVLSAFL